MCYFFVGCCLLYSGFVGCCCVCGCGCVSLDGVGCLLPVVVGPWLLVVVHFFFVVVCWVLIVACCVVVDWLSSVGRCVVTIGSRSLVGNRCLVLLVVVVVGCWL